VLYAFEWFESSDGENWRRRSELSGHVDPFAQGVSAVAALYTQMAEYWRVVVTPVEFELPGKLSGGESGAAAGEAAKSSGAGQSAEDIVFILPDLTGDDRVDGEDVLVLLSVWHQGKGDMDAAFRDFFFERTASDTARIGPGHLFQLGGNAWQVEAGD